MKRNDTHRFRASLREASQKHGAGQLAAARRVYSDLLAQDPNHPEVNNLMGLLCIQAGEPGAAETYIRTALRSDPVNAQAHFNLGIACVEQRRFADAADHFARAARLQPDNVEALSSLGNARRLAGETSAAVAALRAAHRLDPRHRGARHNLGLALNDAGAALNRAGDSAGATERFHEALEHAPGHPQALMNLGLTLEQSGALHKAAECYQRAIRSKPDFSDAHFQLAHLRTHRSTVEEVESMRSLAERPGVPREGRIKLAYALGFALESLGDYAAAFRWMSKGHRLQSRGVRYPLESEQQRFAAVRAFFSRERLSAVRQSTGADDRRAVFIAGMPRSGTTLAEQVLASHPSAVGLGESTALAEAAARLGWISGETPVRLNDGRLDDALQLLTNRLAAGDAAAARVIDTTPMNFPYFGLAAMLMPGARFVHCLRDPMDNGLSIFRQFLTGPRGFEHDLRDLGGYYRLHLDLLQHWQEALSQRLYVLRYERLVKDPEDEIRRLLDFLDLSFDTRCLAFHETERTVRSPSAGQVRQPLYDSSVGAWRRYSTFLQPLADALIEPDQGGSNSR